VPFRFFSHTLICFLLSLPRLAHLFPTYTATAIDSRINKRAYYQRINIIRAKMRYTTGLVLAVVGLAAAQSTTTSAATTSASGTSGCGTSIDAIINNCLDTENAQLASCAANDWDCMCTQTTNVLTCYNNCPTDPNAYGVQQQQTSYCNAAKAYGSSSSSSIASATGTVSSSLSAVLASASSTLAAVNSGFATASSSGAAAASATTAASSTESAAASSSSSAAGAQAVPAGLAAIFGLVAML